MLDEIAKEDLHGRLRRDRKALLWKLDGLPGYDACRPSTATGTNLCGPAALTCYEKLAKTRHVRHPLKPSPIVRLTAICPGRP
jgi:hypothetical protein